MYWAPAAPHNVTVREETPRGTVKFCTPPVYARLNGEVKIVGAAVGIIVGIFEGELVGAAVGVTVGLSVGFTKGAVEVGETVGECVVGIAVGVTVGAQVGITDGAVVGILGMTLGTTVGTGDTVGFDGAVVGGADGPTHQSITALPLPVLTALAKDTIALEE